MRKSGSVAKEAAQPVKGHLSIEHSLALVLLTSSIIVAAHNPGSSLSKEALNSVVVPRDNPTAVNVASKQRKDESDFLRQVNLTVGQTERN